MKHIDPDLNYTPWSERVPQEKEVETVKIHKEEYFDYDEHYVLITIPGSNVTIKVDFPIGHYPDGDTFQYSTANGWMDIKG